MTNRHLVAADVFVSYEESVKAGQYKKPTSASNENASMFPDLVPLAIGTRHSCVNLVADITFVLYDTAVLVFIGRVHFPIWNIAKLRTSASWKPSDSLISMHCL